MDETLRRRRKETWIKLCLRGVPYGDVVEELANKYDKSESAIKMDINRMDSWLPELDEGEPYSAFARLRELRHNRQETQQLVERIKDDDDADAREEIQARRRIDKSIELDIKLSQSLGLTEKEPERVEMTWRDLIEPDSDSTESESEIEPSDGDSA